MTPPVVPAATWPPPTTRRGAIALVTGRGERAPVYERFGRRLSADGYHVAVFEADADAAAGWLESVEGAPRVLVGSDSGAAAVLRVLAHGAAADGAIVAGVPVESEDDEPADDARTACPVHLGVLKDPAARDIATVVIEPLPDPADLAAIEVPVLAIHGGADTVSPLFAAVRALRAVPDLDVLETVDGLHDALNDQSHRSVAASVVLWLERLRAGDTRTALVRPAVERAVEERAG